MLSIHDPLFLNSSTFMRKQHLEEKQIQELEALSLAELSSTFFKKGVNTAAVLFHQMLQSYRIASRVAKAAWGYKNSVDNGDEYNAKEEWANLERSLHEYSPANFAPYRGDIQFAAEYFEALYNELSQHPVEGWEEILFVWTKRLHDMLEMKGPMTKPEVQRVVSGMQQHADSIYPCILLGGVAHLSRSDNRLPMCGLNVSVPEEAHVLAAPSCPGCLQASGIFGEAQT